MNLIADVDGKPNHWTQKDGRQHLIAEDGDTPRTTAPER